MNAMPMVEQCANHQVGEPDATSDEAVVAYVRLYVRTPALRRSGGRESAAYLVKHLSIMSLKRA